MQRLKAPFAGALAALCTTLVFTGGAAARAPELALRHVRLELPGAPAAIVPADLDGDGRQDLVVAVAYTEWDQIGIEESTEMDAVAGLVEVLTIVPALMDRRELFVFLADGAGGYTTAVAGLPLPPSILSLEAGPAGWPVVALTDDGIAELALIGAGQAAFKPRLADRPVLARTGTFVPGLDLVRDLDGDGRDDLLLPARDDFALYLGDGDGLAETPASRLRLPRREPRAGQHRARSRMVHHYPLPEIRDVDGDGRPDLLLPDRGDGWRYFHVLRNAGGGRFAEAVALADGGPPREDGDEEDDDKDESSAGDEDASDEDDDEDPDGEGEVVYFGDLDGDGRAEYVVQQDLADDDAGFRQEMREAKRPPFHYRLYRSGGDLTMAAAPYTEFEATGYTFTGDDESDIYIPGGFQDLDGDGRQDLISLTLDFSLMQAVRVLATHSISIGLDFHVWCQGEGGGFRAVPGLDLSGKFKLNLDDLKIRQLSQFGGDFDGDGKADFVQLGRGRKVTIHRGREGCAYPPDPDLTVHLEEEPLDLSLVRIDDFDADGLTDLVVIQPQRTSDPEVTPPVRLDLYLSGGER